MARITGRIISIVIFLAAVMVVQMPLVIQSINNINYSIFFGGEGLQIVLLIWLVDSIMIAISFEWISLTISIIPFIVTLPIALIYTAMNPAYGWIVFANMAVVIVLIFARTIANII